MELQREANLFDYIKLIYERKVLIVCGTLIPAACAFIISAYMPPNYKIETIIETGMLANHNTPLESPASIKAKIDAKVYEAMVYGEPSIKDEERLNMTAQTFPNTNLILIKTTSSKPEIARKVLTGIAGLILKEHENIMARNKASLTSTIKTLIAQLRVSGSSGELFNKTNWVQIVEQALQYSVISQTRIILEPTVSRTPVSPGKRRNAFLAGALGFAFSVFLSFFITHISALSQKST